MAMPVQNATDAKAQATAEPAAAAAHADNINSSINAKINILYEKASYLKLIGCFFAAYCNFTKQKAD